jgi:molybdopterin synthase sulfur carrier subunit
MHVRALFFATYRDLVGHPSLDVRLPADATVTDLVATLRDKGAPWDRLPGDPAVAVNHEYAPADRALAPGDEVAFIPPVAGG